MTTFNLEIFEDQLLNKEELVELLETTPKSQSIILDTQGEGPSLYECGVIDVILSSKKPKSTISVRTPNRYETLPVKVLTRYNRWNYHFLNLRKAIDYYTFEQQPGNHHRLGCFIGRKNLDRLAILYWLSRTYDVFLSSLREDQINYEHRPDLEQWVDNQWSFQSWVANFNIPSVDNYATEDQYLSVDFNEDKDHFRVHLNMISYYTRFDVELVCETFVRGQTYFPTEKTVRPIAGGKPMIVYGPKHYLKNLRMNGFTTWGHLWDESYDDYEGIERWQRMKKVIDQIHAWGDWEWEPIREQANQIAQANRNCFYNEIPNADI